MEHKWIDGELYYYTEFQGWVRAIEYNEQLADVVEAAKEDLPKMGEAIARHIDNILADFSQ